MTTAYSYTHNDTPVSHADFIACALHPAHSVAVEACAGSGKTWLLVGRLLRLLLAGAAPGSILAITFTRKAAQEMQARLFSLLQTLATAHEDEVLRHLTERGLSLEEAQTHLPTARGLYETVLMAQPSLKIQTFHAWFWDILKRTPWRWEQRANEVVSAQATLLEQTERLQREAWLGFLQRANTDPHLRRAYLQLREQLGSDPKKMLACLLHQRAEWWAFAEQALSTQADMSPSEAALSLWSDMPDTDPRTDWVNPTVLEARAIIARSVPAHAKVSATIRNFQTLCAAPANNGLTHYQAFYKSVLTEKGTIRTHLMSDVQLKLIGAAQDDYLQALNTLAAHLQTLESRYLDWCAWQLNRAAWPCALAWLEEYQQRKVQQQAVDFSDIEWQTQRWLADETTCTYLQMRLDARYHHLLFDEFQDTNPFQWGIVQSWLNGYGGDTQRPSVFMVGDPKQSIYRFRRADPRLFASARAWLQQHFDAQILRTNHTWRNAGSIVDCVNAIFSALPEAQRPQDFAPQTTEHTRLTGLHGVYYHPLMAEADSTTTTTDAPPLLRNPLKSALRDEQDQRRSDEAASLVRLIQQVLPHLQVPSASGHRAAHYGDVMILVRRRTHLQMYEQALLAAGVPYVSVRRGGLLDTPEASDLCALLRFLSDPHDNLALAQTLCSPLFAPALTRAYGSVENALNHLAATRSATWWQALRTLAQTPGSARTEWQTLMAQLDDWQQHAGRWPVHDVLDRIYHQGQVLAAYTARTPARRLYQVQANLREFLSLSLNLEGGRYVSLQRFLEELQDLRDVSEQESPDEAIVATPSGEAVRLLTVHAAKGLEAPLVVLPDTNSFNNERGNVLLFDWPTDQRAPRQISFVGSASKLGPTRQAVWEQERQLAEREEQNLLYVALTRAQQLLLVTGTHNGKKSSRPTWYDQISAHARSTDELPAVAHTNPAVPTAATTALREYDDLALPTPHNTDLENQDLVRARMSNTASVSQQLGTAWHGVLQRVRYADQAAQVLPAVLPRFHLPPSLQTQVQNAVERVLAAPALAAFFRRQALRLETELDIINADGTLKRLDRLVELPDAYWLLDYKWQVTPEQRDAYAEQVRDYVKTLRPLLAAKPWRLGLITAQGELIEIDY